MSYHTIIIVGYLGRDPEMRYTPNGTPVTSFTMATTRRWAAADGSQNEETTWFRVTVWGRQAETVAQYLSKGRLALVEGRLTPDRTTGGPRLWTGQDGVVRASYEVTANRVVFLGGRGTTAETGTQEDAGSLEEDLPF